MNVPYLLRRNQHKIGKSGRASEQRLAREMGGRARPASGAMEGAKGDIVFGEVLLEAKSTTNLSLALKHSWLDKIAREARALGKTPALSVSFIREDGKPITDGEWVLVPRYKFEEFF
jgi:hypothetical protein